MTQEKDSLERTDTSQDRGLLKKIKTASTEALETRELNALQQEPLKKDRDYALMNHSDIPIRKIRHIITERWIKAIYREPNNGVLLFNYGRMHPHLIEDHALGRGLNGRACINELLEDIDSSRQYVSMNQEELFHEAAKRDFQDKCIYQRLAKEYQFINYIALGKYAFLAGGYLGTLDIEPAINNALKLIELYPNDDSNYVLLGKFINYISIISEKMDPFSENKPPEIVFPPNMKNTEDLYLKALEINSLNDEAYVGLGLSHFQRNGRRIMDHYIKALHLNPHNLEAAILLSEYLSDEVQPVTFSDGSIVKISTVIENAIEHTPHYLAITHPWYPLESLYSSEKDYLPVILKKFIASPSLEKHIKRNALQSMIHFYDHSYYRESEEQIANLLSFLSRTTLADRDKDRKLIEYYFSFSVEDGECTVYMPLLLAEFLKTHFPHDQKSLKDLIPFFIEAIHTKFEHFEMAYYYLATLISPNETFEPKGKSKRILKGKLNKELKETFTQQELYKEAAYGVYNRLYNTDQEQYTLDIAAKILSSYAVTLEDENSEEQQDQYNYTSFPHEDIPPFSKKNIFLKALSMKYPSAWPYFYLGKTFKKPLEIEGKLFNSSKELFLTALDIDPYHAESYHQLGNTVYSGENITLLDGTVLSCQQLYTRSIQLGIQNHDAYFQAAKIMKKNQGVILFDDFTYLSKIDLLFRAFSMNETSSDYLKQIALYFQNIKEKKCAS